MTRKCKVTTLVRILVTLSFATFLPSESFAKCFDFERKIARTLPLPRELKIPSSGPIQSSGQRSRELYWAAVREDINRPIQDVVKELKTYKPTTSERVSEVKIEPIPGAANDLQQKAHYVVRPFPFVKVEWTQQWAFEQLSGSDNEPQIVLVSYEKTDGTSHIKHLCGNIVLQSRPNGKTSIFIYEEAQATNRTQEDSLKGVKKTLEKIRAS